MPWTLEIHHIGVQQGDATLIVARNAAIGVVRSVLIDNGLADQAPDIHAYITGTAGLATLDVMILTHYDEDHFNGAAILLRNYPAVYDNIFIFDQGWPGAGGIDNNYINYVRAINGLNFNNGHLALAHLAGAPPRTRITNRVLSYGNLPYILFGGSIPNVNTAAVPAGAPGTINRNAGWLVNREVMWTNNAGAPALPPGNAPGVAGGPPRLLCIAANEWVLQPGGGGVVQVPSGLNPNSPDGKNGRSLVFLLTFEGFRYYIGGDISSLQESDTLGGNGIVNYIAAQGQVHAMKMSHHGSGESSLTTFINQLNPTAAFISCGTDNGYGANPIAGGLGPWPNGHPQQRVLNDLQAVAGLTHYYMTADRSSEDYCRRLNRGAGVWPMGYTAKAVVTGAWGPVQGGWPVAPVAPSPCGGHWPYDTAANQADGYMRIDVAPAPAAVAAPNFNVTFPIPRITLPVLNFPIEVPANVNWPAGVNIPLNTRIPNGGIWPGGVVAPLQGMAITAGPYVLAIALAWPNGQTIGAGLILPGGGAANIGGYTLAANTVLPAGVTWSAATQLPVGTILPAGSHIPIGIVSPTPPGLEDGEVIMVPTVLPAGVFWPNGTPLPAGTTLPAAALFPAGATWPAGIALPPGVPTNGTNLPVGTSLPAGFIFPAGVNWPANTALPPLTLPAMAWPPGQPLITAMQFQAGATLPAGIQWPAGGAVTQPGILPANTIITPVNQH